MIFKNKEKPQTQGINLEVKNRNNKVSKEIQVNIFQQVSKDKIGKVVKWQRSKRRLGTHNTRDVSQLSYSTKKLRKQKGGGRARARNKGAPHFRGGAKVHGPEGRDYEYSINKKEKLLGLKHALALKIQKKRVIVLEQLDIIRGTVKSFKDFLSNYNISEKSILIMDKEKNPTILRSINNVYKANFLPIVGLNVEDIVNNKTIVFSENAIDVLKTKGVL